MGIRELQEAVEQTIFVGQAHRLGVFDDLDRSPDTAQGLSLRRSWDLRAVSALLDALVEMGYLRSSEGQYHITPDCRARLVDRDGPSYEGDFWQFLYYLINPWRTLEHVLVHGGPDTSSYAGFDMDDFIRGMDSPWKKKVAPEIVDICIGRNPGSSTVADIGGAPGTIAREFAARGLRTIVFDLPKSLAVMKDELSRVPNIIIEEGDATKELPRGPWDIAFLGNLCHGQSPKDNGSIISMCYERLSSGGIIVIFDNIRGISSCGATLALHMMTQSPLGNVYSLEEYYKWTDAAGFIGAEVTRLSDPAWQLIIARK